jgi:hypothetical protein
MGQRARCNLYQSNGGIPPPAGVDLDPSTRAEAHTAAFYVMIHLIHSPTLFAYAFAYAYRVPATGLRLVTHVVPTRQVSAPLSLGTHAWLTRGSDIRLVTRVVPTRQGRLDF